MLRHSFCHLKGIGTKTERKLWQSGIRTWEELAEARKLSLPSAPRTYLRDQLEASQQHLADGDAEYFAKVLPSNEQWRLLWDFGARIAYLDIETTGLGEDSHITAIAFYDGKQTRTYVHGVNLEQFADDILGTQLLVTYNGRCFDVPIIERELRIKLPRAHIDLRLVLIALGFKGGLKRCEHALGLMRGDLEGVDGAYASVLWHEHLRSGNPAALETLLAYNVADVLGLEVLLARACNLKLKDTPM